MVLRSVVDGIHACMHQDANYHAISLYLVRIPTPPQCSHHHAAIRAMDIQA